MNDCIFCKILSGDIPSTEVYSNAHVYAFRDINPKADSHILVIPRTHIESAAEINADNSELVARCFEAIAEIVRREGLSKRGFRVISNAGEGAGQTVPHLHFHVLSGSLGAF
ncbi:MAG: histidine triad nucleotide-binding protein [Oscillospiraceae bacterium]|jgi:histidine triad (HIT) family protein|nr:histidine triad nucleotide-binding protein [Oscillospiraceae bacterium]